MTERYSAVARSLHWAIALLILAAIPLGLVCASIGPNATDPYLKELRDSLLFWHKSLGLTVLILGVARIAWTLTHARPALPGHLPVIERRAAKVVHWLLYIVMIGMPVTGILLSQSAGFPVSLFGLFKLPEIFPADVAVPLMKRPGVIIGFILHKRVLAYTLYTVLALHVIGLLKHHIIDRDPSIWRRMSPWK